MGEHRVTLEETKDVSNITCHANRLEERRTTAIFDFDQYTLISSKSWRQYKNRLTRVWLFCLDSPAIIHVTCRDVRLYAQSCFPRSELSASTESSGFVEFVRIGLTVG